MRYTLLSYQDTEARNGLFQDDEDVFMDATGDIIAGLSAPGDWVGSQER